MFQLQNHLNFFYMHNTWYSYLNLYSGQIRIK